ncbi:hypothetical protein HOS16_gp68 [Shigella phage vB_SflS-ISF001]|uniref:Uncharacterized protein n=1 Tax=Shigella phage vB_SflS-ISF001 TaxID=2048005 RepID=A0A2D1GQ24_9CAUD|nr:hypothetical protein HOS16_gp68 [Shigella phage vB_SflS-ISF001]ATN94146.1 hypothetical protein FLXISF001_068 [Shigella phage vB_SflS-ISF001]
MARRITNDLKVLNKVNVVIIQVIWGYNEVSVKQKLEAPYDLAVKAMPSDDRNFIANYVAFF